MGGGEREPRELRILCPVDSVFCVLVLTDMDKFYFVVFGDFFMIILH